VRLDLVQSVFDALDKKKVGYVSLADAVRAHDAAKHPSVMFGDKTPAQAQQEFLESFQVSTRQAVASASTAFISLYQWMTYFQYLSGHVPNDEYFELLLRRVWRAAPRTSLTEFASDQRRLFDASATNVPHSSSSYPTAPMSLLEALQDNRIAVSDNVRPALTVSTTSMPPPAPVANSKTTARPSHWAMDDDVLAARKAANTTNEFLKGSQFAACMVDPSSPSSFTTKPVKSPTAASAGLDAGSSSVLGKLRATLKTRGLGALVEVTRAIRLNDENGDGRLSLVEFKSAVKSEPMLQQLSDVDLRCLFKHLDRSNQGAVPISDVLDLIREPMNSRRRQLVHAAFYFLDKLRLGALDPFDVVQRYDASRHPDVISQRKTEEQLFQEFVDNFDVVDETSNASEGKISPAQWEQYYHNVSFFVPDDDFFELMIRNTWQLPASAIPPATFSATASSSTASLLSPLSALNTGTTRTPRGSGMRSHQAFAILQPDLSDQHQERAAGGAGFSLLPPPSSGGISTTTTSPSCMFSANKQSKELRRVIHQLRAALKEQGAVGFISLQRKFRAMDSDRNGSISLPEFLTALRESGVYLSPLDAKNLFHYFDANHDGAVDFSEFLAGIREPMSEKRMLFVRMAFDLMDKDGNGLLEVADIVDVYDARKHPEVMSGRKTEQEVFAEFLDTFEASGGGNRDGKITFEEWTHYYANISAAIDDDDYFELMMRNAWHISGGSGWSANSSNRRVLITAADGSASVREVPNDLGVKREDVPRIMAAASQAKGSAPPRTSFYEILDHTPRPAGEGSATMMRRSKTNNGSDAIAACLGKEDVKSTSTPPNNVGTGSATVASATTTRRSGAPLAPTMGKEHPAGVQAILTKMKIALKGKGAHGFCGLSRTFRLMDEDGNGSLNLAEFRKAVTACDLAVADADVRLLFQYFDSNRNGSIDLSEFIGGVRDPMNERRVVFVREAFKRMDKDGNGLLEPSDIVEGFDASQHPDVLSGRKTPEQVCREFLETFDVEGAHNGKVTWDQWLHYYHNISASIDDDDYFELMMRNAWHISGGVGWCGNTTNRRVLVTLRDGTDVIREVENDLGIKSKDVQSRLLQQERSNNNASEGLANSIAHVVAFNTRLDLTDKRPQTLASGKKILSLKDISTSAAMEMNSASAAVAAAAGNANCSGDVVLMMIRLRLVHRSVADVVQLRKRLELSADAKTTNLTASSCRDVLNVALGLSLTDAHCIALFEHLRQVYQRPEDDVRPSYRGGFGVPSSANQRVAVKLLVQGIVGMLSAPCRAAAQHVFTTLQATGKGRVFPTTLAKSFRAGDHPSVKLGLSSAADVFHDFARAVEIPGDGAVAFEHFETYCANLRATVGSDELLLLLLRECF
jgi:Ca2+-binding EF-hand superfamily protein